MELLSILSGKEFSIVNNIKLLLNCVSNLIGKKKGGGGGEKGQIWPSPPLEYLLSCQKTGTDSNTLLSMKLR